MNSPKLVRRTSINNYKTKVLVLLTAHPLAEQYKRSLRNRIVLRSSDVSSVEFETYQHSVVVGICVVAKLANFGFKLCACSYSRETEELHEDMYVQYRIMKCRKYFFKVFITAVIYNVQVGPG